jgi:NAD(P)-dependent dehydrogenase (short-subunit alcohol dehydrogenase family)
MTNTQSNRVALVTGAAGNGMGRSIALTLAREGAKVVVNYRTSEQSAKTIVKHIESCGGNAIAVQADISDKAQCEKLVDTTIKHFGHIDICIIGPGGGWHPETIEKIDSTNALDDIQKEISPIYYLMSLILPDMYKRKWGRIVGISLHPTKLPPAYAYNVAKAARTQALLLAQNQAWPHGVTINIIAPGAISKIKNLDEAIKQCEHDKAWLERINLSPQDIAEGITYLCSESGKFISGCVLPYIPY